jgi:hypothetical protein
MALILVPVTLSLSAASYGVYRYLFSSTPTVIVSSKDNSTKQSFTEQIKLFDKTTLRKVTSLLSCGRLEYLTNMSVHNEPKSSKIATVPIKYTCISNDDIRKYENKYRKVVSELCTHMKISQHITPKPYLNKIVAFDKSRLKNTHRSNKYSNNKNNESTSIYEQIKTFNTQTLRHCIPQEKSQSKKTDFELELIKRIKPGFLD